MPCKVSAAHQESFREKKKKSQKSHDLKQSISLWYVLFTFKHFGCLEAVVAMSECVGKSKQTFHAGGCRVTS